jgi:acyl dehydratase
MTAVSLHTERLGDLVEEYRGFVNVEDVRRYAAATGRPGQDYRTGDPAPPLFGSVPARRAVLAALRSVVPAEVGELVPVLHGEHDVVRSQPLRCGAEVTVSSRALGVRQKASGCTVLLEIGIAGADGPVERQRMVVYLPGAVGATDAGLGPEVLEAVPTAVHQLLTPTAPGQSRDYAAVSGDDTSFHVDDEAARAFGFRGVILHGLCTLATAVTDLTTRLGHGPDSVARVSGRFVNPAYPGETLLVGYVDDEGTVAFRAMDQEGRSLLDRARIELR